MKITDSINFFLGGVVAALSYVFGDHWVLFAIFIFFNFADWITGWAKSRIFHKENSMKGLTGIIKKMGYWLMVFLAFALSYWFVEIGKLLGKDFSITTMIGWFVLASLTVNEFRSILENFVQMGYKVPHVLIKGLEVADKAFNADEEEEVMPDGK